ncbi:hypothetical protein L3X38_042397 [Prunus dulcis]|uniref:Uncharacterized protein n=1 Tax=Prunus dulcis TaxID=3755 RepID=A0AAD4YLX9_PRUDU|nr:hypothetical protein L3X38_042397 [Prunus dulcis]
MVADHQALKCLCICEEAPKCTRRDANDPGARIITFCPFYFSLGFTFPLSKFFREVFCAMECGPSQCTPNVYWAIMCFENLSRFFKPDLTVQEFFYYFEVRHYEMYAQVLMCKANLFDSLSQTDWPYLL